jgi:hypothetical protein
MQRISNEEHFARLPRPQKHCNIKRAQQNAWPVWVGANASATAIGTSDANYDTVGHRFYIGVKAKL